VNPVAVDDTLVAAGRTNLRPNDNSSTVELLTQEGDSVALTTTEDWGYDSRYQVSLELEDVQMGTYTLESNDSYDTDTVEVEIVQNRQTAMPEPTDTTTTTEAGGPGFGASSRLSRSSRLRRWPPGATTDRHERSIHFLPIVVTWDRSQTLSSSVRL
jgi:hypothetical protein